MSSTYHTLINAGEPCAIIRVKNLQSIIHGVSDAWGRKDRSQPILVSAEVSMAKPFSTSSQGDVVAADTVHYGILSKRIQKYFDEVRPEGAEWGLKSTLDKLRQQLVEASASSGGKPLLQLETLRHFKIMIHLTKASLIGGGVSLTHTESCAEGSRQVAQALKFHDLRVPILIGVNDNERQARQVVIANIEIDRYESAMDNYAPLEALVTKTMTDSSFETLEALAAKLAQDLKVWLHSHLSPVDEAGWKLTISLEKPVAVPFADASCVETISYTGRLP